ncbi:hypothetical protein [Andreprevotia chitinilytica]|uniref:hypothetical protein n=1 Tax=Andreprevotia chitinilytica TaxID=396808 RepID=UPI0005528B1F|nr:hypothetical protein [Andreprevotia chitinilytica]
MPATLLRAKQLKRVHYPRIEDPHFLSPAALSIVLSQAGPAFADIRSDSDLATQLAQGHVFYVLNYPAPHPLFLRRSEWDDDPVLDLAGDAKDWKPSRAAHYTLQQAAHGILRRDPEPLWGWGPQVNHKLIRMQRAADLSFDADWVRPKGYLYQPSPDTELPELIRAVAKAAIRPIRTGLGEDVDELAAHSPTLQRDLKRLKEENVAMRYGVAGDGSWMDARAGTKEIILDGNLQGHPAATLQTLAHEIGHATYLFTPDISSREAYVNSNLANEGAATLKNIEVQREILANAGIDIELAGSRGNHAGYNAAYDRYKRNGNATAAKNAIGQIYGRGEINSITHEPYADYYGNEYDRRYGN